MKNRLRLLPLALLPTLGALAHCSSSPTPSDSSSPPTISSKLARDTAPNVSDADRATLLHDNDAFAASMYGVFASSPASARGNLFFSPYSISVALAMAYAGASDETATQMASAMHFTLPQDRLHPAFDALDLALNSRGSDPATGTEPFALHVVNSLWAANDMSFVPSFLDTLAVSYGAGVRIADFGHAPEQARATINKWVEGETNDKIVDLLPGGSITGDTRAVLVDAIYFKAGWASHFRKEATLAQTFHGASDASVDMMRDTGSIAYAEGEGWKAVGLPYESNQVTFVAVLPDDMSAFEGKFTANLAESIAPHAPPPDTEIALSIPKIKITGSTISLKDALKSLGMIAPFTRGAATFANMTRENVYIDDVLHQAFIATDEDGTEAAAATAVVFADAGSALPQPKKRIDVTFDKPFVFFIRDNASGTILFLGRYSAPTP